MASVYTVVDRVDDYSFCLTYSIGEVVFKIPLPLFKRTNWTATHKCQLLLRLHASSVLFIGSTESESDVKLAHSCQSAPIKLITGTAERGSTRDACQQTSEMQLMPCPAVTETVWTVTAPDAPPASTTPEDAEPLCPCDDDDEQTATDATEQATPPPLATADESETVDDFSTAADLSRTSTEGDVFADAPDQFSRVSNTKYHVDSSDTLLSALNKQETADTYEDWLESPATKEKVSILIKDCKQSRPLSPKDLKIATERINSKPVYKNDV